jgi:diguanylate cyclase (GGDEF)-like protein
MNWFKNKPKQLKKLRKCLRRLPRRLARRWAYALVLLPALAEWLENAHPPISLGNIVKTTVVGAVIGVCVWRLYRDSDELKKLAETDELTGLLNRRRFNEDMQGEITRAERLKVPLTLLYLDVDDFKRLNDTHGHVQGDLILGEVGRFLKAAVRQHLDSCYRIGGDEFAVLMVGAHVDEAVEAIGRRREELTRGTVLEQYGVTFSVGAVELDGASPRELVKKADRYMYAAKRGKPIAAEQNACFAKV